MAYIFLDESGDLGFNPKKKNSKFFLVTIVFASDKKYLEKAVKKIHRGLRKKVKRLGGGILHCTKEKPATRRRLLRFLVNSNCKVMTIYVDKSRVYSSLRNEKHLLYNYVVNILLDRILSKKLIDISTKVILVVSKRETNKFLNLNFQDYLRRQVKNKHRVNIAIEIRTPAEEKSLQAVDFISWAVFHKYEHGQKEFYSLIEKLVVEENRLFK
jgi:hypothetical protein